MQPTAGTAHSNCRNPARAWLAFAAAWGLIAAVWLGLLPRIAASPAISSRLDELDAQGIDPSAMYYSELPVMDDVLTDVDAFHRRHPDAVWTPCR